MTRTQAFFQDGRRVSFMVPVTIGRHGLVKVVSKRWAGVLVISLVAGVSGCASQPKTFEACETRECMDGFIRRSSESSLVRYVHISKDPDIQKAAIEQVKGPDALRKIALADDLALEIRKFAVNRIQWPPTLKEIVQANTHVQIRRAARARILNILDSPDPQYRAAAVRSIDDQQLVMRVANEDPNEDVRAAAAEAIADQMVLAKIALTDESPIVTGAARSRLTETSALLAVYEADPNEIYRAEVVSMLRDQDVLKRIAESDTNDRIVGAAWQGIEDQSYLKTQLKNLLATRSFPSLFSGHFRPFFQAIDDRELIVQIARTGTPNSGADSAAKGSQHVRDHAASRLLEMDNGDTSYFAPPSMVERLVELKLLVLDPAIAASHGYVQIQVTHSSVETDYHFQSRTLPLPGTSPAGTLTTLSYELTFLNELGEQIMQKSYTTAADRIETFRLGGGSQTKINLFEIDDLCRELAATLDAGAQTLAQSSGQRCLRALATESP